MVGVDGRPAVHDTAPRSPRMKVAGVLASEAGWRWCLLSLALLVPSATGTCELPTHWRGSWFQSGVRELISITRTEFSSKGVCTQSSGEKFLFKDRSDGCYRCVVISEKHPNVLQYKETLCEPSRDLSALCAQITGDALLYSMFRSDATQDSCPFKGPLTFSYTGSHGECNTPASTIDSCTSDSRLLFKYQACPDVQGTESSEVVVECIGHWKEGSTRYFVGRLEGRRAVTDEDRYRCFAWERGRNEKDKTDYRMAQSGDATCNGVFSAYDGAKNLRIKKAGSYSGCEFPPWVAMHHRWHALDKGVIYSVVHHNTTLKLHRPRNQPMSLGLTQEDEDEPERSRESSSSPEEKLVCSQQLEATSSRVMFVTHVTTGCTIGYICTVFYRRNGHIIEMQQGSRTFRAADACSPEQFNASTAPHTTLTSNAPSHHDCPFLGVWTTGEGECGRDVTHLRAGCSALYALKFVHACATQTTKHSFVCHGHWAEGSSVFVVASTPDRPTHRLCLIATSVNNKKRPNSNSTSNSKTLQITAHAHSCPRHHVPRTTPLSFNLTAQGQCAVAGNSSSSPARWSPLLIQLSILLHLAPLAASLLSGAR